MKNYHNKRLNLCLPLKLFHDGGRYHIETSFYMTTASVMKVNHSFPQRVEVININHVSLQKNDVTFGNGGIYTIVIQPNKAIEKV